MLSLFQKLTRWFHFACKMKLYIIYNTRSHLNFEMASCVSEGSYNTMFGVGLAVAMLFVLVMAFYTHTFTKIVDKTYDQNDATTGKHISQSLLVTSIVIALIIVFLYFGNTSRMRAAYLKL